MQDVKNRLKDKIHQFFLGEILRNGDRGEVIDDYLPFEGFIELCVCSNLPAEKIAAALFNVLHGKGVSYSLDHSADKQCLQVAKELVAVWQHKNSC